MIGNLLSPTQARRASVQAAAPKPLTDEEMAAKFGQPQAKPLSDEEMAAKFGQPPAPATPPAPAKPKANQFVDYETGQIKQRTMTDMERMAGAAVGALEFPMMGFNDEFMGTTNALMGQAAEGLDYVGENAFGIDPNLMPKGYRASTMAEGRADAKKIKDRYAAARETGEIGMWDADNTISNIGNIAGSVMPYEGIYNAGKVIGRGVMGLGAGLGSTIFGLGTGGAAATALTTAGNEAGDVATAEGRQNRIDGVVKAGGGPLMVGAVLNILGAGLGQAGAKGVQGAFHAATPAMTAAARKLMKLLDDAGLSVDDIQKSLDENQLIKPDATLDTAGPRKFTGWMEALGAAARGKGPAKAHAEDILVPRQQGDWEQGIPSQGRKTADAIADAYGNKGGESAAVASLNAKAATRAASKKPYNDAYAAPHQPSAKLDYLLQKTPAKAFFDETLDALKMSDTPESNLVTRDANGNVVAYGTEILDQVYRNVKSKAEKAYDSGDKWMGDQYKTLWQNIRNEADNMNKLFPEARKAFSDSVSVENALKAGQKHWKAPRDVIRNLIDGMDSEPEKLAFLRGLSQQGEGLAAGHALRGDAVNKVRGTTQAMEAMQEALGREQFGKLMKRLDLEDREFQVFAAAKLNSATDRFGQMQSELSDSAVGEMAKNVSDMANDGVQATILSKGASKFRQMLEYFDQSTRGHIAKMLLSRNPAEQKAALALMKTQLEHIKNAKILAEQGGNTGGGLVNAAGQPVASEAISAFRNPQSDF